MGGSVGAMRSTLSSGSYPLGNGAPAGVSVTPAALHSSTGAPGASLGAVKADEVAPVGAAPGGKIAQFPLQDLLDELKFGPQNRGVAFHMRLYSSEIGQKTRMTQLIELVITDHLMTQKLQLPGHIGGTGSHGADARHRRR